jgi:hypothetical protein
MVPEDRSALNQPSESLCGMTVSSNNIKVVLASTLVLLMALTGCNQLEPGWISETPEFRPCGAPTQVFEDSLAQGSFEDVFQFPNGVLFCSTGHNEENDPRPEASGRVTIITFSLTNPTDRDYRVGNISKNIFLRSFGSSIVEWVKDGYIEEPYVIKAGETAMMRFVYKLTRKDWKSAHGSFSFRGDFDGMNVAMIGLE